MPSRPHGRQEDETQLAFILFLVSCVLGLLARLAIPASASFPLNDGGLFLQMTRDIAADGFGIPAVTTYNHAAIPFAYPPLALWLTALAIDLLGLRPLVVFQIAPALVSALTVPAFFLVSQSLLRRPITAGLATLLFALTPRTYEWQIMGGGITRAPGFLFALLALNSFTRGLRGGHDKNLAWAAVWAALTALTHPEAAFQLAIGAALLFLVIDHSARGAVRVAVLAVLILILAAPWWATVLSRHGVDPFLAAIRAAGQDSTNLLGRLFSAFRFEFTGEAYLSLAAMLTLIGLAAGSAPVTRLLLAIWMFVSYLAEPRGGTLFMMIPASMLGGLGLEGLLHLAGHPGEQASNARRSLPQVLDAAGPRTMLAFIIMYMLVAAYVTPFKVLRHATLKASEIRAMAWIGAKTPPDATFLVLTAGQPLLDPASDWFPALSDRISAATAFGYEWHPGFEFAERIRSYQQAQACVQQSAGCLLAWSESTGIPFTHVYIGPQALRSPILTALSQDDNYRVIYTGAEVIILERIGP